MTASSETYWDVDGFVLDTFGWAVRTRGGAETVPEWRGADRRYPYRAGAQARSQVAESRTLSLPMFVEPKDENGVPYVGVRMDEAYETNRRTIMRAFWKPRGELFALTKRWREGGVIKSATAMGRLASDAAVSKMGPVAGRFTIDVFLPDPWFYGAEVTTTVPVGTPTVITNTGDDTCNAITVAFVGQLTNPLLTNQTPNPDVWMKVGTSVAVGDTVNVDIDKATVKRVSDGANLIGAITHSGAREWMGLRRGTNTMVLSVDGGAGHADVKHRPAYW